MVHPFNKFWWQILVLLKKDIKPCWHESIHRDSPINGHLKDKVMGIEKKQKYFHPCTEKKVRLHSSNNIMSQKTLFWSIVYAMNKKWLKYDIQLQYKLSTTWSELFCYKIWPKLKNFLTPRFKCMCFKKSFTPIFVNICDKILWPVYESNWKKFPQILFKISRLVHECIYGKLLLN